MPKYIIQNFDGGIADKENYGIRGSFKPGSRNLNIRGDRDGLTCNQALTDVTAPAEGFTGLIDWFVPASDGNIYGFARNGRIYRFDNELNVTLVYTDTNGAIVGAWEWGLSNGKQYLFWATATRLNCKEIPGNATWSADINANVVIGANTYTYPKTDLTSPATGFNHMMKGIGGGVGALAICNDETLALVGYDGSYTTEILRFTPGNASKTLIQRGNNLLMGTKAKNQLVQSAVFLWDGHDTEEIFGWDDMKVLPVGDIKAMIDCEVPLLVDEKGQVFYSDFSSSQPLFTFPGNGTVSPGGVTNDSFMALFGVWGNTYSGIYSYGRKNKNASLVPNLEYYIDCDEIGAIIKVSDLLLVSYKDGLSYGVKTIDFGNKATATYISTDLPKPAKYTFQKSPVWDAIVLHTDPLPQGCSISLKYRLNKTGDFLDANLEGGSTSFDTANAMQAVFFTKGLGEIAEFEVTLTPSGNDAPFVRSIEWYFS
jgi:hypothetical protein